MNEVEAEIEAEVAKEKGEYIDTLQPTLERQMNTFDEAWETMWVPKFNGLSDGSVDIYTAYSNLKELNSTYDDLFIDVMNIRVSNHFTDKNSKLIQDFKNEFSVAVSFRSEGVSQAMDMIDLGNFSPSEMDAILDTISLSDSAVLTAVSNKVTLDHNFDVLDDE